MGDIRRSAHVCHSRRTAEKCAIHGCVDIGKLFMMYRELRAPLLLFKANDFPLPDWLLGVDVPS